MDATPTSLTRKLRLFRWIAVIVVLAGLVLLIVSIGLDWDGFWGGMGTGVGIGAMITGTYYLGYANGLGQSGNLDTSRMWLPSRRGESAR